MEWIMFYKVLKDDRVIDVLDRLIFIKYQPRNNIMVMCSEDDAQAILSSDGRYVWHEESCYNLPVSGYDTVSLVEIDRYEYERLKMLNGKTPQEIIDAYTLSLICDGVI